MSTAMWFVQAAYFVAAVLFILGLKRMSSPKTARGGFYVAGIGMVIAVVATFFLPGVGGVTNIILILVALALGGVISWVSGKRVSITAMPQMVALYNGMGGGAAAAIAAHALTVGGGHGTSEVVVGVVGALIGAISFSGSLVAFAKLQGWMTAWRFPLQNYANAIVLAAMAVFAALAIVYGNSGILIVFFLVALALGVLVTVPVGGADMPVMISLYNAMTGLAVGFEGYVFGNPAMIVAGMIVGAAGTLLTVLMAKGMNRSVTNVLFAGFGETAVGGEVEGEMKPIEVNDAAAMMAYANHVIIAPGYGMAVAQAQHKLWEFVKLLGEHGVKVSFAIHPVAGRMPGHMNVLLAEAGVPYDKIHDLEEINEEFATADVALVIGANDVVNPAARDNKTSPIYGMPILNVDRAENVICCKRGKGRGFSGIENELFFRDNTRMLYGDAQESMSRLIQAVKAY
ncbi:MAG: NAD(P)(+) transhydrogenase (Re/Si-specific) subunit beta [Gammaproteobacteria bacterium]|nr:NAD(P)(+) transhydrogenase (Re/Si-specific) subunit beta [Gammaproteobacteria bacterium]